MKVKKTLILLLSIVLLSALATMVSKHLKEKEIITVTFVDYDGTILKEEKNVGKGASAIAPTDPTREGYIFKGWDKEFDNVTEDITVTALYEEITEATIIVSSSTASAGDTVTLLVQVVNNPGVAGAKIKLTYDSKLTLIEAKAGPAFEFLDYTAPAKLQNECNFNWDSLEGQSVEDGTIIELKFTINNIVERGETLNVSCSYVYGDIYDKDLNDITFNVINGTVIVK